MKRILLLIIVLLVATILTHYNKKKRDYSHLTKAERALIQFAESAGW